MPRFLVQILARLIGKREGNLLSKSKQLSMALTKRPPELLIDRDTVTLRRTGSDPKWIAQTCLYMFKHLTPLSRRLKSPMMSPSPKIWGQRIIGR